MANLTVWQQITAEFSGHPLSGSYAIEDGMVKVKTPHGEKATQRAAFFSSMLSLLRPTPAIAVSNAMSAIPSKADIAGRQLDVRFVPQTDSRTATSALFYFGCPMGVTRVKISRRKIVRQQITSERGRFGDSLGNDVGQ
jgi:hypothetical protein